MLSMSLIMLILFRHLNDLPIGEKKFMLSNYHFTTDNLQRVYSCIQTGKIFNRHTFGDWHCLIEEVLESNNKNMLSYRTV